LVYEIRVALKVIKHTKKERNNVIFDTEGSMHIQQNLYLREAEQKKSEQDQELWTLAWAGQKSQNQSRN